MGGPTDFSEYITPEKAYDLHLKGSGGYRSLKKWRAMAKGKGTCLCCDLPIWRYAGTGLCFPCTTGESDASDDYELLEGLK